LNKSAAAANPRFLIRGFSPQSGGYAYSARLNTTNFIIPHAFINGKIPHRSIFDIPDQQLKPMIDGHLRWGEKWHAGDDMSLVPTTEFTSWTVSLPVALHFGRRYGPGTSSEEEALTKSHLCIIDTWKLKGKGEFFHVNDLHAANLAPGNYPYEYLAHGRIDGPGLKVVPVEKLIKRGLLKFLPDISSHTLQDLYARDMRQDKLWGPLTLDDVIKARNIAQEFGEFAEVIALAILTVPRAGKYRSNVSPLDPALFIQGMGLDKEPENSILTCMEGVYVEYLSEVAALKQLVSAVLELLQKFKGRKREVEAGIQIRCPGMKKSGAQCLRYVYREAAACYDHLSQVQPQTTTSFKEINSNGGVPRTEHKDTSGNVVIGAMRWQLLT
jgi:hypothetical protein